MIFLLTGPDVKTVVLAFADEHRPLCYREIVISDLEKAAKAGAIEFRCHVLNEIERRADTPEHDIGLRVEADKRIGVEQKVVAKFVKCRLELCLKDALRFGIKFPPFGIHPEEHEI